MSLPPVAWSFDVKSGSGGEHASFSRGSASGDEFPSTSPYARRPPHRIQSQGNILETPGITSNPSPPHSSSAYPTSFLDVGGSDDTSSFLPPPRGYAGERLGGTSESAVHGGGSGREQDGYERSARERRGGRGTIGLEKRGGRGFGRNRGAGIGGGGGESGGRRGRGVMVAGVGRRAGASSPGGESTSLVRKEWDVHTSPTGRGGEGAVRESTIPFPSSLVQRTTEKSGITVAPPPLLTITPTFVPYVDNSKKLTPEGTVRELHKNYEGPAKTAKGRAIQEDLRKLANDYFGGVESRAPPKDGDVEEADEDGNSTAKPSTALALRNANYSRYARFDHVYLASAVPKRWWKGPLDSQGQFFDASDRNLLCMDVQLPKNGAEGGGGLQCVVGSADHGLRVFDTKTMKELKNLYNKDYGHTEWVTACKYLPSGQILSGGMDSKLCLWNRIPCGGPAKCQNLLGHTASISQVEVNDSSIAVSASYDRTLRIWDCNGVGKEIGCLGGHKAAVMQFSWNGDQIISGDRQGHAKIWDLPTAACVSTLSTKRGQISALGHLIHADFGNWTMFGDQGGVLTVLDFRQGKKPVYQEVLHPSAALTSLKTTPDAPYIISCGADSRILVLDPRKNFEPVHTWTDHKDYVYSMETMGSLVLSGGGNGWLLVHDTKTGKCLYGLGASTAAVRSIFAAPKQLICAGDDGKAAVYDY